MNPGFLTTLPLVSALGCGLMAGVFFAFSAFVMNALARIPAAQGIAAMQSINVVVINSWFGLVFFGTALVCLLMACVAGMRWNRPGAGWMLAGSLLYLLGVVGVTLVCNVPRNDALALVKPGGAEGARLWADYLVSWTAWNHVRTAAALAATATGIIALVCHVTAQQADRP